MEVSELSFCDNLAYNIKNNKEKSDLLRRLFCKYKINFRSRNQIFNDKLLSRSLHRRGHVITLLTGGEKMWLYLTKIKNENFTLLIYKSILDGYQYPKIIIVNFRFENVLYNDTLLDVELIKCRNQWQLLIHDLLVVKGRKVSMPYLQRIELVYSILHTQFIPDPYLQTCDLKVKRIFNYNYDELCAFITKCQYRIIGITFHSEKDDPGIEFYFSKKFMPRDQYPRITFLDSEREQLQDLQKRQAELLEEIHEEEHQCKNVKAAQSEVVQMKAHTFYIRKTKLPNIFLLFSKTGSTFQKESVARIDTIECAQMINHIFTTSQQGLVDCLYDITFNKWVPFQISKATTSGPYLLPETQPVKEAVLSTTFSEDMFDI